jgi:integrase
MAVRNAVTFTAVIATSTVRVPALAMLAPKAKAALAVRLTENDRYSLHSNLLPVCSVPLVPLLSALWRRATKGIVDTTFHATRHTYASKLIKRGVDVVTVQRRLGHHSPSFNLKTYAHLFDEQDTKDAAVAEELL